MSHTPTPTIELLAPAGSPEAFIVALEAGADAVYLGLKDFNARKRAKNFTVDEFKYAVNYAHHHNKKVYLTLNTLVFDNEFESVIDILDIAEDVHVDAVIVQDIGLIHLLRTYYPSLSIHASTQTFCHNSLHAQFLKNLGVSRIILPRELSLAEIKRIAEKVPLEYEVFIHGAMCFSFSGCCLFSSYLFGESGNRGRCLQPCRFPFTTSGKTVYPFSMKDLAIGPSVHEFINAGITHFKIEGRLKSTWYIQQVVSYYRLLLDAFLEGKNPTAKPPSLRSATKGYMHDSSYHKLVDTKKPGVAGTLIGTVSNITPRYCVINVLGDVTKGSRLRIVDEKGKKIYEGTLLQYSYRNDNKTITWHISLQAKPPLYVYQIGESKSQSGMKKLKSIPYKPYHSNITIDFGHQVHVTVSVRDFTNTYNFDVPIQKALTQKLSTHSIQKIFQQTAHFPFTTNVTVNLNDSLFIPLSIVKQLRRTIYTKLYDEYVMHVQQRNTQRKRDILETLDKLKKQYVTTIFNKETFESIHLERITKSVSNDTTFIELPLFVPEEKLATTLSTIEQLIHSGYNRFIIPTYGWIEYFKNKKVLLCAGDFCYIVNSFTYEAYHRHSIMHFTISRDMQHLATHLQKYYGYIQFSNPRVYLATRLRIPDGEYSYKNNKFCVQHFAHYDILTDCT